MALTNGPSPDHPIHRMKASEFAQLIEQELLSMAGGRPHLSHGKTPDGSIDSTFYSRIGNERISVEKDTPPDDAMGPPLAMAPSTSLRVSRDERARSGKKPSFTGGVSGAFNDLHNAFIGVGIAFGNALDKNKLGNDPAQQERIQGLLAQWSDHLPALGRRDAAWVDRGDYPEKLAAELAKVEKVPLMLTINGEKKPFVVDNVRIGLHNAPLAHVLLAVQKNSIALNGRSRGETDFITQAVSSFSQILVTTDQVLDYIRAELVKQGIENPDKVLKDSHLAFDSERAERILIEQAPGLKLSNVIAPLALGYAPVEGLNNILSLVGQHVLEIPPVQNAEQGTRLLEAILFRLTECQDRYMYGGEIGSTERQLGIDSKAIKTYLRTSAHDRPFDVARLAENEGVQKLLATAAQTRAEDPEMDRALRTFERALENQKDLAGKREGVSKATIYTPGRIRRIVDRVWEGQSQTKPQSRIVDAIDSGMNRHEFDALMRDVITLFEQPDDPKKNFSQMIHDQMEARAKGARKDIPPLP